MDIEKLREELKAVDTTPPEGYLEGVEDQVLQRMKSGGRRVLLTRSLTMAASVAVIVLSTLWWFDNTGEVNIYDQVSEDVLALHYVETYEDDWLYEDEWMEEVSIDEMVDLLESDGADEDIYAFMNKMMK